MAEQKADIKADIEAVVDRGEDVRLMEPLLIGETARERAVMLPLWSRQATDRRGALSPR
jgi:hypothetical protein